MSDPRELTPEQQKHRDGDCPGAPLCSSCRAEKRARASSPAPDAEVTEAMIDAAWDVGIGPDGPYAQAMGIARGLSNRRDYERAMKAKIEEIVRAAVASSPVPADAWPIGQSGSIGITQGGPISRMLVAAPVSVGDEDEKVTEYDALISAMARAHSVQGPAACQRILVQLHAAGYRLKGGGERG